MPDGPGESLGGLRPTVPQRTGHAGRKLVLAACLIATFMAAVESTIIATIIPTIVGELGGFTLFTWVFTVYLLTQAVTIFSRTSGDTRSSPQSHSSTVLRRELLLWSIV